MSHYKITLVNIETVKRQSNNDGNRNKSTDCQYLSNWFEFNLFKRINELTGLISSRSCYLLSRQFCEGILQSHWCFSLCYLTVQGKRILFLSTKICHPFIIIDLLMWLRQYFSSNSYIYCLGNWFIGSTENKQIIKGNVDDLQKLYITTSIKFQFNKHLIINYFNSIFNYSI